MRGVNRVTILGNVGQDPEVKYLPSGGAVTNISVATSESWKDKNTGQKNDRTEWHKIVFFNRLGEIAGEYLRKGSKVYIEGSLRTRKWQAQDGTDRYSTEIVASEMQMLDGKNDSSVTQPQQPQQQNRQNTQQQQQQYQQYQQPQQYNQQPMQHQQQGGFNGGQAGSAPQNFDDFDSDIPFSPIGLQYGKRSVLAM